MESKLEVFLMMYVFLGILPAVLIYKYLPKSASVWSRVRALLISVVASVVGVMLVLGYSEGGSGGRQTSAVANKWSSEPTVDGAKQSKVPSVGLEDDGPTFLSGLASGRSARFEIRDAFDKELTGLVVEFSNSNMRVTYEGTVFYRGPVQSYSDFDSNCLYAKGVTEVEFFLCYAINNQSVKAWSFEGYKDYNFEARKGEIYFQSGSGSEGPARFGYFAE